MSRVLFLDIDGVLLPGRMQESDWNRRAVNLENPPAPWAEWLSRRGRACATEICPQAVAGLNALLTAVDARMVLISTWRDAIGCRETRQILSIQGVADRWHEDFAAPWTGCKGDDVVAWLLAHPEIERWAVLDDEMIWAPWGEQNRALVARHVRPDFQEGVTADHWGSLKRLLQPLARSEVRTITTHTPDPLGYGERSALERLRHMAQDAVNHVNDDAVKDEAAILRARLNVYSSQTDQDK